MDDNLKNYIFVDDADMKEQISDELLNESTAEFIEECKMENLLLSVFDEIDVSQKTLDTISETDEGLVYLAGDVLETIKKNKRKQRKQQFIYIFSGIAAVLALSFVLINLNTGTPQLFYTKSDTLGKSAPKNLKFKETIQLPEGVVVRIIEDSEYELVNSENEFLRLTKGSIYVEVDSRANKSPLYFKMPHNTVKVIGTSFTLTCDSKSSFVAVHEGTVELIKKDKVVKVSARQSASANKDFLGKIDILNGLERLYSFEKLNDLNFEGSPKLTRGIIGNALKLDGASKVILPRSSQVPEESISFWFQVKEFFDEPQAIIGQNHHLHSKDGFNIFVNNGHLSLQLKKCFNKSKGNKTAIIKNKWHHVVFTRGQSGDYSLYLDGKVIVSGNFQYFYRTENILLGKSQVTHWKPFVGSVDELRIYNRPLSYKEQRVILHNGTGAN
jgi:hypothetical protein